MIRLIVIRAIQLQILYAGFPIRSGVNLFVKLQYSLALTSPFLIIGADQLQVCCAFCCTFVVSIESSEYTRRVVSRRVATRGMQRVHAEAVNLPSKLAAER